MITGEKSSRLGDVFDVDFLSDFKLCSDYVSFVRPEKNICERLERFVASVGGSRILCLYMDAESESQKNIVGCVWLLTVGTCSW